MQEYDIEIYCEVQPKRNINCMHYDKCLSDAARINAPELKCEKCSSYQDNTYQMNESDFYGLMKLYAYVASDYVWEGPSFSFNMISEHRF